MIIFNKRALRQCSLVTVLFFVFSILGSFVPAVNAEVNVSVDATASLDALSTVVPEISHLQSKIQTTQATIKNLENVCAPIHSALMPTNMEAMSIAERVKAILNNAKDILGEKLQNAKISGSMKLSQGTTLSALSTDEQLAISVDHLGAQAAKITVNGGTSEILAKVKEVVANAKKILDKVVVKVRSKIFSVGQKAGLIDENKVFEDGKVIDKSESKYGGKKPKTEESGVVASGKATTSGGKLSNFKAKLSQGVSNGIDAAKSSLKNSFSFSNLAMTTTVAVGTNLAIDVLNGEKPSFKKAVKSVASLEFAANVAGSALGAAGGQFTATLVKTFVPGIAGQLIGSVIPVMFSSASGQMASNLVSGIKNGEFSVIKAFKQIDKADLVGSSIGSTIGMTLGSMIPIPVVGSVVGGIVGGFIGSKVAKWVSGLFTKKKDKTASSPAVSAQSAVVSESGNIQLNAAQSATVTVSDDPVLPSEAELNNTIISSGITSSEEAVIDVPNEKVQQLQAVKEKYYETYLTYNRQLSANQKDAAKATFEQLKLYAGEYARIRKSLK